MKPNVNENTEIYAQGGGLYIGLKPPSQGTQSEVSDQVKSPSQSSSRSPSRSPSQGTQSKQMIGILDFCREPRQVGEIRQKFGYSDRTYFRNNHIQPLLDDGMLEMTIPDKPTSSQQKYRTTAKGLRLLEISSGNRENGSRRGNKS